jgi:hypothetical protein
MRRRACKKYKLDVKGSPIGIPLLFVCDATHVKSITYMLRDRQSGVTYFLYATLRM